MATIKCPICDGSADVETSNGCICIYCRTCRYSNLGDSNGSVTTIANKEYLSSFDQSKDDYEKTQNIIFEATKEAKKEWIFKSRETTHWQEHGF